MKVKRSHVCGGDIPGLQREPESSRMRTLTLGEIEDKFMLLDLHVRFRFSLREKGMSQRSQRLAECAKRFLKNQPVADAASLNRKQFLDEGFRRLSEDVRAEFEKQTDELNHEPACGNVLICRFSDGQPGIFHKDRPELSLSVKFDAPLRLITIECETPVKFKYFIGVKLNGDETSWYYTAGEKKTDLAPCRNQVDWIVDKALNALFGNAA
ncbi:MAG: hypothetical protein WBD87_01595 [Candidatus Acidiferrales bacterium]